MRGDAVKWSSNKPTKPGWYWWKDRELGPDIIPIVEVSSGLVYDSGLGVECQIPVGEYGYKSEWAGPIPEPEEV